MALFSGIVGGCPLERQTMTTNLKTIGNQLEILSDMLDDLRELTQNSILADGMANISKEFFRLSLEVNKEDKRRQEMAEMADRKKMVLENIKSIFTVYDINEAEMDEMFARPKKAPFLLTLKYNMRLNGFDFSKVTLRDEEVAKYAVNAILADLTRFKNGEPSIMQRFLDKD